MRRVVLVIGCVAAMALIGAVGTKAMAAFEEPTRKPIPLPTDYDSAELEVEADAAYDEAVAAGTVDNLDAEAEAWLDAEGIAIVNGEATMMVDSQMYTANYADCVSMYVVDKQAAAAY